MGGGGGVEAFDVIRRGQSGGKRGRGETSAGCVERELDRRRLTATEAECPS